MVSWYARMFPGLLGLRLRVLKKNSVLSDYVLTHWGRVMHICVSKLIVIGSDNGLSPGRRQAITWTNAGILLIAALGTNFSEILIEIATFSFKKMHLKMSSGEWRQFCLGLNVLNMQHPVHNTGNHFDTLMRLCRTLEDRCLYWQGHTASQLYNQQNSDFSYI